MLVRMPFLEAVFPVSHLFLFVRLILHVMWPLVNVWQLYVGRVALQYLLFVYYFQTDWSRLIRVKFQVCAFLL